MRAIYSPYTVLLVKDIKIFVILHETKIFYNRNHSLPPLYTIVVICGQWRIQTGFHSFCGNPLLADMTATAL